MLTRSLRGKVFLLVFAILLVVATVVMLITQRDVTQTVVAREEHAVDNTLNLVLSDTDARWGALLDDKITVVRQDRNDLIELCNMMNSVLSRYATLADTGRLSTPAAQQPSCDDSYSRRGAGIGSATSRPSAAGGLRPGTHERAGPAASLRAVGAAGERDLLCPEEMTRDKS